MNSIRSSDDASGTAIQSSSDASRSGSAVTRLLVLGLAIGAGIIIMKQMPDLKRYLKMKAM